VAIDAEGKATGVADGCGFAVRSLLLFSLFAADQKERRRILHQQLLPTQFNPKYEEKMFIEW